MEASCLSSVLKTGSARLWGWVQSRRVQASPDEAALLLPGMSPAGGEGVSEPLTGEPLALLTADGALVLRSCLGPAVVWASAAFACIWEDGPLGSPVVT